MPSIRKNRTHRSLSSYLSSLNKENHLDFGNRNPLPQKKGLIKIMADDPVYVDYKLKQSKEAIVKPLPPLRL